MSTAQVAQSFDKGREGRSGDRGGARGIRTCHQMLLSRVSMEGKLLLCPCVGGALLILRFAMRRFDAHRTRVPGPEESPSNEWLGRRGIRTWRAKARARCCSPKKGGEGGEGGKRRAKSLNSAIVMECDLSQ